MSPVKFWERGVNPWPATPSGLRPTWDPQDPPGEFDSVRDDLLVGDMFDVDLPEPVRHPSKHILTNRRDLPYPEDASSPVTSANSPAGHASGGGSSPSPEANLSDEQPGRGRDQAA